MMAVMVEEEEVLVLSTIDGDLVVVCKSKLTEGVCFQLEVAEEEEEEEDSLLNNSNEILLLPPPLLFLYPPLLFKLIFKSVMMTSVQLLYTQKKWSTLSHRCCLDSHL